VSGSPLRTVTLWRIGTDTPRYTAEDLSGRGAKEGGGRWNRTGTPLVYASTSRALACLETLVHLAVADFPLNRYLVEIRVPLTAWDERIVLDPSAHIGWDAEPAGMVSLDWGTDWASRGSALLAEVPSMIVPEESNVLVNPRHADARSARARKVREWTYDYRLGSSAPRGAGRNRTAE
jgi:RES domain-containing protein